MRRPIDKNVEINIYSLMPKYTNGFLIDQSALLFTSMIKKTSIWKLRKISHYIVTTLYPFCSFGYWRELGFCLCYNRKLKTYEILLSSLLKKKKKSEIKENNSNFFLENWPKPKWIMSIIDKSCWKLGWYY